MALIFAGALNFFSYWYSDRVIMKMYQEKEVGPNDNLELYGIVQDLAQRGGLPMPRVFAIPQGPPRPLPRGEPSARRRCGDSGNSPYPYEKGTGSGLGTGTGPRKKPGHINQHDRCNSRRDNQLSCMDGPVGNDFR